jgi:hypothetical protein
LRRSLKRTVPSSESRHFSLSFTVTFAFVQSWLSERAADAAEEAAHKAMNNNAVVFSFKVHLRIEFATSLSQRRWNAS